MDSVRRRLYRAAPALLLGLVSCSDRCGSPPAAPEPVEAGVGVDGCATRPRRGGCMRPPPGLPSMCEGTRDRGVVEPGSSMSIVVWADQPGAMMLDGQPVSQTPESIDGGLRWQLSVPPEARTLELRCEPAGTTCWSMALGTVGPEPAALTEARTLRNVPADADGLARRAKAVAELEQMLPDLEAAAQRAALDVITDLRLQVASVEPDPVRRRAAYRDALQWTERAFDAASASGEVGRASCHARRAVHYALGDLGDPERAQRWRTRLATLSEVPESVAAKNDYYAGVQLQQEGDLKGARAAYLRAERGARRFSHDGRQRTSMTMAATVLARLGRETEVEQFFGRARADQEHLGCVSWLMLLNNHSYSRHQLSLLGRPAPDPVPDLDEVLTLVTLHDGVDPCYSAEIQEHARLNLALVASEQGWTGEAERLLEAVVAGEPAPSNRFWIDLLRQQIVLAEGEPGALRELAMRDEPPHPSVPPERRWLLQHGRGQAFEALGLSEDAIAAYRAAERSLDEIMRSLDFDTMHERLLRGRQQSAGRLVALLAASGRHDQALCMARRARRRTHDALDRPARISALSLEERERWRRALADTQARRTALDQLHERAWSLPTDQLPAHAAQVEQAQVHLREATEAAEAILYGRPRSVSDDDECRGWRTPGPGEVALLYFPVDAVGQRWQGFAYDADGVQAVAVLDPPAADEAPLAEWSAAVLEPFAAVLRGASSVAVLPTGRLWSVPFAALPFEGDIVLAHAPVVVSLDLASRTTVPASARTALVVGDPGGDLPAARREADAVTQALDGRGWTVDVLLGQSVRASELRERLPGASLLHYAGHAEHGGTDGWGSALRLSGDRRLEVQDVMTLSRVPPVVMLPACDTASIAPATLGGGMSIARAFLLAGAQLVVASQDLLDDQLGLALAESIYAQGPVEVAGGPQALRRAILEVRGRFAADAWRPVVALVP